MSTPAKNRRRKSSHPSREQSEPVDSFAGQVAGPADEQAAAEDDGIAQSAAEVWTSLQNLAQATRRQMAAGTEAVAGKATDYVEEGRDHVQALGELLERKVREKPLTSMLLAAGAGCLLGALCRWRR